MASNFDIVKILNLIAEGEDPETIEKIAKKLVEKYPSKAAFLIKKMTLDAEFQDNYITITSATELNSEQKKMIEAVIEKKTQKKQKVTYLLNEDLLGGIVIRQGEKIIDNSLRNRVKQLTNYIKETKFNLGA